MSANESFVFRTKAETLADLKPLVKTAHVPELMYFSLAEWNSAAPDLLDRISKQFGNRLVVIRSSALSEDAEDTSMAGQFDSVLSVPAQDTDQLAQAISTVADSLPGDPGDKVLVQEMAQDIQASGVIMTFDVSRGAPYYCIEFDDETGRTDMVTSGGGSHKSLYVYRNAPREYIKSGRISAFLDLAQELENLCDCAALDIEFGLDRNGQLHLFQTRRIVLARNWHPVIERRVERQLVHLEAFLEERSSPRDGLLGERTILAVMPDWNPAEIIGTTPRPLAASLYRTLITDAVWARARAAMGYRDLGDTDLMVLLGHQPYIDVRNSFNSFLPAGIDEDVGARLVNAWMDRLEANPELHDKVEFGIVPTCYDFTFEADFSERYPDVLSKAETDAYAAQLVDLTRRALSPGPDNTLQIALDTIERMTALEWSDVDRDAPYANLDRAHKLLQVCSDLGTFSFSVAARHAFIAEALLRSAVRRGALEGARFDAFKRTIRTVSGDMLEDYSAVAAGRMERRDFFRKYGHLLPGTYELTSLRYDERGDNLFSYGIDLGNLVQSEKFELSETERTALAGLLSESGLDVLGPDDLIAHAARAIAARENIKFKFTRVLSDAMTHILRWGHLHGLSREDLSYLNWSDISEGRSAPRLDDLDRHFLDLSHQRRRDLATAQTLKFAHIIFRPRDIYVATLNRSVPNFIGLGIASGKVHQLTANASSGVDLEGCIVCIENADPGFDWIFTKGLAGLVTRFGGANSHMAVRSAELGIPAAIGCGDQIFERIAKATQAELNCTERFLRPLHG
ncbi:PEP/pyruvate-binding domain-containing protein [Roseovarius sp. S1116L3]|uniref:PEP/pyruvate-binding domain-containing protein n=1 Tax=Roseovarius roseus TaxID=3342636 RepID=UPI003728DF0B